MSTEILIRNLSFTGPNVPRVELAFLSGANLIYGASNTGKSFTLKAIDFMLGGSKKLPSFEERNGYEAMWLGLELGKKPYTLYRALKGGKFALYEGLIQGQNFTDQKPIKMLEPTHDSTDSNNISVFFLERLGFDKKLIARNANGDRDPLSFRDLVTTFVADETAIQAERSPIEGGQHSDVPFERGVFRFLLTGVDDTAVIPVVSNKDFKASKIARTSILEELILDLDKQLTVEYPDIDTLAEREVLVEEKLSALQSKFDPVQARLDKLISDRSSVLTDIPQIKQRLEEINFHLSRFTKLNEIYASDIQRLELIEESGFLLSIEERKVCPLCGASPESQNHEHDFIKAGDISLSAKKEISKIKIQIKDLYHSINELQEEKNEQRSLLTTKETMLLEIENEMASMTSRLEENKKILLDVIAERDRVKKGLNLVKQKQELENRVGHLTKLKGVSKKDRPKFVLSDNAAHEFCITMSDVLKKWGFPGQNQISFDSETYDVKIDGKLRIDNGKGVRAITHAAFKIALLIYCNNKKLPHPGIVILDTPLLTYRDPLKNPKFGELTPDEIELAKRPIKENFFRHLETLSDKAQFIILENVDPPSNVDISHIDTFYGEGSTVRAGLFPSKM